MRNGLHYDEKYHLIPENPSEIRWQLLLRTKFFSTLFFKICNLSSRENVRAGSEKTQNFECFTAKSHAKVTQTSYLYTLVNLCCPGASHYERFRTWTLLNVERRKEPNMYCISGNRRHFGIFR